MRKDICHKCICDFYVRIYNGNPRKYMDINDYNFLFTKESNGHNWVYWYEKGILYNCIQYTPRDEPVGLSKAMELIKNCPYITEHIILED